MDLTAKEVVWGAIFMSNKKTKKECLRRRLFGLPDSQSSVVKQVKSGMMLFLFEYEQRLLHGVFEAVSDGSINIEPDAFRSLGKSFAAQVRIKRIWSCDPLSEREFCVAIKDNYFTDYKFNFLLSQEQVSSLLHLFSLKKIVVLPSGKTGVSNKFFNQSDSSGVARIRTDPDLEMRTRRALLEEARVSKLNRMEYDSEFPHFQHQSELAATTCNEDDGYDPDRALGFSHNPGASVDPYFSYSSFHPSMELDGAKNNSLRYRCQPRFAVSRNDDSNIQHQSELAATTGGEDGDYDPYRALVITHNPGALVDPHCSYSSYHSSMELDRAGSTFLTSRSQPSLAVSSNEDYISLTADDNDDMIGFFEPPSGSRYFKLPTAGGFIYEEAREQKSENLIPYSPPSDVVSGSGTRAIESHTLKGFGYADHDQRRSVFSRLSGFPLMLPNEGNRDNVFSEDNNSLTANDLIQRLFDRQSGGMFCSVFSRLSGGDRLFRKDSGVPISNFMRRSNVHNVDDNVDAEIESAGMKRRIKRARLSLENVKDSKVVPFETQKLKADEEINRPS